MPVAQFEEKTYEQHLTMELLGRRPLFLPPGQMLENTLGFDVAIFTRSFAFWHLFNERLFSFPWWKKGLILEPQWWRQLEETIDYFPQFKFNAFLQYKRPEYLADPRASEWKDWNGPYYRYGIVAHQQSALDELQRKASTLAITAYASPAFHTYTELWNNIRQRSLIGNSNFAEVSQLSTHFRYTYSQPGTSGIAYSEPTPTKGVDIFERMDELLRARSESTNRQFLNRLSSAVEEVMHSLSYFTEAYLEITSESSELLPSDASRVFVRLGAFTYLTNTIWIIGTI